MVARAVVQIPDEQVVDEGPGEHALPLAELSLVEQDHRGPRVIDEGVVPGDENPDLEAEAFRFRQDVEQEPLVVEDLLGC